MNQDIRNRSFLGAIAAAIKALCSIIISLVGVGNEAVEMLDSTVKSAREKQTIDLSLSMADYGDNAVKLAAKRQLETSEQIEKFLSEDTTGERGKKYAQHHDHLTKLVNAELARIAASRQE